MPPDPSGRPNLFVLEAGEALQRLAGLLGAPDPPGDGAVRAARILRGASLLGGPADFTRSAAALESAIKGVHDGAVAWEPRLAEVLRGAVEGLEGLLRRAAAWSTADAESAVRIAGEIERVAVRPGAEPPRPFGRRTSDRHEPGVRAFLAREATIVAGAVERLARETTLDNPAAIRNVLRTTQPLRGIAFLGEVPPLGDLLEVIEGVLETALAGPHTLPPRTREGLSQLAGALTRAARDLADTGTPALDAPELAGAARVIRDIITNDGDIVSIEGLFADGDPAPVVHQGTAPRQELPGPDAALTLHALAGRLIQAADQHEKTAHPPLAALQQTALLLHLRAGLPPRPALPTDRLLAALVQALVRGAPEADGRAYLDALRQGAAALSGQADDGGNTANAPGIAAVTAMFDRLPGIRADAAPHRPPEPSTDLPEPVPIESLLMAPEADPDPVVPIETLLAAEPDPAGGPDLLESSLLVYEQLLAGVPSAPALPAPARATAAVEVGTMPMPDGPIVPIETLLYRGRGALERAGEVRREIDAAIAAIRAERRLEPLLRELMDLIPLALDDRA